MDKSDLHSRKHDEPRISTVLGITIDGSDEYENASDSIRINREFNSNEMDESDLHDRKHNEPRVSTLLGITIDGSDDCANAFDSIRINREFDSNKTDTSDSHPRKHDEPRISRLLGIIIDSSDDRKNAFDSIRINRELDSNEMHESDPHNEKHDEPRISTLLGITIDCTHENENVFDSIRINREFDSKEIDRNSLLLLKEPAQIHNIDSETHVCVGGEECSRRRAIASIKPFAVSKIRKHACCDCPLLKEIHFARVFDAAERRVDSPSPLRVYVEVMAISDLGLAEGSHSRIRTAKWLLQAINRLFRPTQSEKAR
jgi:hypothetical protein